MNPRFNKLQFCTIKKKLQYLQGHSSLIEDIKVDSNELMVALENMLLCSYYILDLNRSFDPDVLDQKNIEEIENRLNEISSVSHIITVKDTLTFQKYKEEIQLKINILVEILAKNCVRIIPNEVHRYTILSRHGFDLNYTESHNIDFVKPSIFCFIGIIFATLFSIIVSLLLMDYLDIKLASSPDKVMQWFSYDRIYRWTLGASISYIIATAFGVFFNEVCRKNNPYKRLSTYLFTFIFSALGSCIFFSLAERTFQLPHVMLAISYGMLSIVAIECRDRDLISSKEVLFKSISMGLFYGVAAGILQNLIRFSFSDYNILTTNELVAFFVLGFLRSTIVAFLVAYVLLDAEREQIFKSKRRHPRIGYRKVIDSLLNGKKMVLVVKDISERGALVKMTEQECANEGDFVYLVLGFADIKGEVIWSKNRMARIRFNESDPNISVLRSFIGTKMKELYSN